MKRHFPEHLNLPPLVELDGYGCCIECRRNIKAGRSHQPLCTVLARKEEAAAVAQAEVIVDPERVQREIVAAIDALNERSKLEERLELDRIAAGTPKAQRKRKGKAGAAG